MKKIKFLSVFLLVGITAFAQKNLTIEEATYGQYRNFAIENIVSPQWRKDTKTLTFLDNSYSKLLAKSEEGNWAETTLLTKDELQNALKSKFSSDEFQLRMFPYSYSWIDKNTLEFEVEGKNSKYLIQFDVAQKVIQERYNRYKQGVFLVELGYNFQLQKEESKAKKYYEEAVEKIKTKPIVEAPPVEKAAEESDWAVINEYVRLVQDKYQDVVSYVKQRY